MKLYGKWIEMMNWELRALTMEMCSAVAYPDQSFG
jgi:hypothetical protein